MDYKQKNVEKKFIYVDNAATTRVDDEVVLAMQKYLNMDYGNPSSLYSFSDRAEEAVQNSREKIAKILNCKPKEIYFTSGGTESDNWALKGACFSEIIRNSNKNFSDLHIITSKIEHHAVLHTAKFLEKLGVHVTYLDVDSDGLIEPELVEKFIQKNTVIVSIMYANNEVGTVQDIAKIGEICRKSGVIFHTDAVQAIGHEKIDVKAQNIDMLSISAHKFHGPKGIGALYIKEGLRIENLLHGGAQESKMRAGTENVGAIVGFGVAIEKAYKNFDAENARLISMRDKIIDNLSKIPKSYLNGHKTKRLSNNISFCFEGVEGESLIMKLDRNYGICVSSGSACTSGDLEPSHVLIALGRPHEIAHGSLRITLSKHTAESDVEYICEKVRETVESIRKFSPIWNG